MKKKIIVLGNINSIWIKQFVEYVLIPKNYEVYLDKGHSEKITYESFYESIGVHIIGGYKLNTTIMNIPIVNSLYLRYKKKNSLLGYRGLFDGIFVFFSVPIEIECALYLNTNNIPIVSAFIGSDILKANKKQIVLLNQLLKNQYLNAVCTSAAPYDRFKACFPWKNADVIRFSIPTFSYIDNIIDIREESIEKTRSHKRNVCIGYNARKEQQHIKVIEALAKLPQEIKQTLVLVLPMTYLVDEDYIKVVEESLMDSGLEYHIIRNYMDSEAMAKLWLSIDIYINAQKTDALSASMLEALYAGAIVISGGWLKYKELDEYGIDVIQFSDFSDLTRTVAEHIDERRDNSVHDKLKDNISIDKFQRGWNEYINTLFHWNER